MKAWYSQHLGIPAGPYGWNFKWRSLDKPEHVGLTVWSTFPQDTEYFGAGEQAAMINYRVHDLEALLEVLKEEGVQIAGEMQAFEYGKFAWIVDPEGNRIELWEPIDEPLIAFEAQEDKG